MTGTPEDRLRALLDEGTEGEKRLLLEAEELAKERGVFARRQGWEGFMTIKAALKLAIAVWKAEGERRKAGSRT